MKRARAGLGLSLLLVAAAGGCAGLRAARPTPEARAREAAAERAIRHWSEGARATARQMIAEYGPPDRSSRLALRWIDNGPWAKTIVHHSAWPRVLGPRSRDRLEQTVNYQVPLASVEDIQRFDERLEINRRSGQLSALSSDEPTNILLLNLAYEIATGQRDVRSARAFAARAEKLAKAGKSSRYTASILFPTRSKRIHAPAMVPGRPWGYTDPEKGGRSHE